MNFNKSILMTLGHNSSVIFTDCETKPIGFEEERLTGVKSDSTYPLRAFEEVLSNLSHDKIESSNLFISHWFDSFEIEDYPEKYFNHEHFISMVRKYNLNVIPLNASFTHHDAHAYSSKAFAENFNVNIDGIMHYIVADGFGNNQEVLSIYKQSSSVNQELELVKRVYGYSNSLGLLYQYATSYCGMKENQDEYKFLGYEVGISEFLDTFKIEEISILAYESSMNYMANCLNINTIKPEISDGIISFEDLLETKSTIHSLLDSIYDRFKQLDYGEMFEIDREREKRTIVGFYAQSVLENVMLRIVQKYNISNVCLSGGCFLNVKLNNVIMNAISGHVSITPLAGDQGAAIGLFNKYTKTKFNFSDLCFGNRNRLDLFVGTELALSERGINIFNNDDEAFDYIVESLQSGFIVNLMRGDMEFGPRALCNTSTLALPHKENAEYINMVNNRNEVMPMAPVMLEDFARVVFDNVNLDKVIGSDKFMIITHEFNIANVGCNKGVLHTKALSSGYTCRPQIVDKNSYIGRIVEKTGMLINTSFNTHGTPILFKFKDGLIDYNKQKQSDFENRLKLVIINKQ